MADIDVDVFKANVLSISITDGAYPRVYIFIFCCLLEGIGKFIVKNFIVNY